VPQCSVISGLLAFCGSGLCDLVCLSSADCHIGHSALKCQATLRHAAVELTASRPDDVAPSLMLLVPTQTLLTLSHPISVGSTGRPVSEAESMSAAPAGPVSVPVCRELLAARELKSNVWIGGRFRPQKWLPPQRPLRDRKTNFRSFMYSHSFTVLQIG